MSEKFSPGPWSCGSSQPTILGKRKAILAQSTLYPRKGGKRKGGKRGYREDLGHSVRSELEAKFARLLKMQKIKYEYEVPIRLEFQWLLDFSYQEKGELRYAEVKGHLDQASMTRLRLLKEQRPAIFDRLLLVTTSKGHGRNWGKILARLKRLGLKDEQIMDLSEVKII